MGCIRRRNQSHSPGCIAIHCARIHPLRFWRVSRGFVASFTRFPSETRSGRLSGARKTRYGKSIGGTLLLIMKQVGLSKLTA
jgi:hypothetical protein